MPGASIGELRSVAAASVGEMSVGAGVAESHLLDVVRRSRGELLQEVHSFGPQLVEAQLDAVEGGAHLHLVGRSGMSLPGSLAMVAEGRARGAVGTVDATAYGHQLGGDASPYLHSKLLWSGVVAREDAPRALFTNVSPVDVAGMHSATREDVTIDLLGSTAQAAHDVLATERSGTPNMMRAAIDDAARAGLLVDDAVTNASHLTATQRRLLASPTRRLLVLGKGIDDVDEARAIAAAHVRGVPTMVVVRQLGDEAAQVLRDAKVPTLLEDRDPTKLSRMNVIVADDEAVVSTSYGWQKMLGSHPDAAGLPTSRESGVLLADSDVERLLDQLAGTQTGGPAVAQLRAATQAAPARGLRRLVGSSPRIDARQGATPGVLVPLADAIAGTHLVSRLS